MLKKYYLGIISIFAMTAASAHITLEQPTAAVESTYKAVFRVGHGCDGSATKSITVFMPAGIVGAKPMPKAGWALDIKMEKLEKPYDSHGTLITERASQVTWSGGTLPDNQYDEFVARMTLPLYRLRCTSAYFRFAKKDKRIGLKCRLKVRASPSFPRPCLR